MPSKKPKVKVIPTRWSSLKVFLVVLNVVTTILTLATGLWNTPILTSLTGRYDYIRQRLRTGSINRAIAEPLHYRLEDLPTPIQLAEYSMAQAPRRDPKSFGEYHSVCTNINTMSAPVLVSNFDDFWGKGARRVQTYMYSISAPHCDVVTVKQEWRDQCIADHGGDATKCHQYVLDNFDSIQKDKLARAFAVDDFGTVGVPFLRCLSRPLDTFSFQADLLSYETIWAGSEYHVTIQTSDCRAEPLAQSRDQWTSLFQSVNVDDGASMTVLLPPDGWIGFIILWVHSLATVVCVSHGMINALLHTNTARYLPAGVRFGKDRRWVQFMMPFMPILAHLSGNERAVITFKGSLFIASDVWKTHWLFMWVSVLDSLAHLRKMYVTFQLASMLRFTPETFVYLCGAITKITWAMCFVQTVVRMFVKLLGRCLRSLGIISAQTADRCGWDIDGISMFLSWRVFNLILSLIVMILMLLRDGPTFMEPTTPAYVGAYGGPIRIASLWGSELGCDIMTLLGLTTLASNFVGLIMVTCTKYKYVADNSIMRLLGDRYYLSGWDGLLAADMLGLDPSYKDFLVDDFGYTKLSIGSLIQLMYQSGPSGLVHLAGDYIFHDSGFSKEPTLFSYTIQKALSMGLIGTAGGPSVSVRGTTSIHPLLGPSSSQVGRPKSGFGGGVSMKSEAPGMSEAGGLNELLGGYSEAGGARSEAGTGKSEAGDKKTNGGELTAAPVPKSSVFDRRLRVVSEGFLGKLLLVDVAEPGRAVNNKQTGHREFVVLDALTMITIMDIKWILGSEKKIRVR